MILDGASLFCLKKFALEARAYVCNADSASVLAAPLVYCVLWPKSAPDGDPSMVAKPLCWMLFALLVKWFSLCVISVVLVAWGPLTFADGAKPPPFLALRLPNADLDY